MLLKQYCDTSPTVENNQRSPLIGSPFELLQLRIFLSIINHISKSSCNLFENDQSDPPFSRWCSGKSLIILQQPVGAYRITGTPCKGLKCLWSYSSYTIGMSSRLVLQQWARLLPHLRLKLKKGTDLVVVQTVVIADGLRDLAYPYTFDGDKGPPRILGGWCAHKRTIGLGQSRNAHTFDFLGVETRWSWR